MIRNKINCLFSSVACMLVCAMLLLTGCVENPLEEMKGELSYNAETHTIHFGESSYTLNYVEKGTFRMGSTTNKNESPIHKVYLSSYYIGQTEVTRELWDAIMGTYTSFGQEPNIPITNVSWDECQEFLTRLNALTGQAFRLPTEAEWEFAARGGNKAKGYTYSGSNYTNIIGWYKGNSQDKAHPIATKSPNELGLYDMSGNVWEWCQDKNGTYSNKTQTNPTGHTSSSVKHRVKRGGSYKEEASSCTVTYRASEIATTTKEDLGFRIVLPTNEEDDFYYIAYGSEDYSFVRIEGNIFTMGSNGGGVYGDESPAHQVSLSSYYIGKTEVTVGLWDYVMGTNVSDKRDKNYPITGVSWTDCQEFITKLNALTKQEFRLPTEAEWEFAAKSGNPKWNSSTNNGTWKSGVIDIVGNTQPNEAGIYDMMGNAFEWCSDYYGAYSGKSETNPTGSVNPIYVPEYEQYGALRVVRSVASFISVPVTTTMRYNFYEEVILAEIGLRLVLPTNEKAPSFN